MSFSDLRESRLTLQQINVLRMVGMGLSNRQIAGEMRCKERTVKYYVTAVCDKLELQFSGNARTLLIKAAYDYELVRPDRSRRHV
jgi:two-component system response regulator DevR